jgi:SAM-dependent methyltransferase
MNILEHNRTAWNRESLGGSRWAQPVDSNIIEQARLGHWKVILTPEKAVPRHWFGELRDKRVLCLASGGGQQSPILAAAGAQVVSFDLSEEQLAKDALVAKRDGLDVQCVQGNMADLSTFPDGQFDLIFHPVSNVFAPDVLPVWRECFRVLKDGGRLLAGFMNPAYFLFDYEADGDALVVRFKLPYKEPEDLSSAGKADLANTGRPLEFSHSLESQIGGQLAAGFVLRDLYEDYWSDDATPLNRFSPTYIATLAEKLVTA